VADVEFGFAEDEREPRFHGFGFAGEDGAGAGVEESADGGWFWRVGGEVDEACWLPGVL
jgi:hypothetical protein